MMFSSLLTLPRGATTGGGLRLGATSSGSRPRISMPSRALTARSMSVTAQSLTITRPDDWHLHVRNGESLKSVVPFSARQFGRAIIMPNLQPPVTTTELAMEYREQIVAAIPEGEVFDPLMTLYLTDSTPPEEIEKAKAAGVKALKLYPAGATTNSDAGVTNIDLTIPTLEAMQAAGMPLLVHGEVVSPDIDIFDRERIFIEEKLIPLLNKMPNLKVVMEHITTADAAEFVASAPDNVAATVTPQHMLMNRNSLFDGGVRVHNFCLPVLKRERHREAVAAAVTSGSAKFFLGTDSAPHPKGAKECACGCAGIFSAHAALPLYATAFDRAGKLENLEGFASFHGPDFYGLPRNTDTVTLVKEEWEVPAEYDFGDSTVVPMWAGKQMPWRSV